MSIQPLYIEISGISNAGKTTLINSVVQELEHKNLKVTVLSADADFNSKKTYSELMSAISERQKIFYLLDNLKDYDIVLFDNCGYHKTLVDYDRFESLKDNDDIALTIESLQEVFHKFRILNMHFFYISADPFLAFNRDSEAELIPKNISEEIIEDLKYDIESFEKINAYFTTCLKHNYWEYKNELLDIENGAKLICAKIDNLLQDM